MGSFLKTMTMAAVGLVLTGCAAGEFSLGGLSPSAEKTYEIIGAGYGESFDEALRAMEEADLDIVHSDREEGRIAAEVRGSEVRFQDVRTIAGRPAEFVFTLEQPEADRLVFTIESNAGSREGVERFLRTYGRSLEFAEAADPGAAAEKRSGAAHEENAGGAVISEIRTGGPRLPEEKVEFTRQEIIEIQAFLYKLGYDPGPADGILNSRTEAAIEKFKTEYGFVKKLF